MLRHRSIRNEALSRGGASCAEARPNPLAAQQLAAADPAGEGKSDVPLLARMRENGSSVA